MSVRFTTDYSVNYTGFAIDYIMTCGGLMRGYERGYLSSPNYPSPYNNNANCTWRIIVTTGRTVKVRFNGTFNIDSTEGSCGGDYVQLLNGGSSTSPPLGSSSSGRYCGSIAPATMETNSNELYINFVSDGAASAHGFSLIFEEVRVACGDTISLTDQLNSATIMSPNYPAVYPHNVDCVWIITVPAAESVQVEFDENFNVEQHTNCNFDFIELRNGGTSNAPLIGRYCGTTRPSTIKSTGNVLYARFRTDNSVPRSGFKATVHIARCGGTYIGNSGTISSPNYPSNYDSSADCEWYIRAPTGHYLTLTYDAFNTEGASDCTAADYVEIREYNRTGPLLKQSCGTDIPAAITTSDSFAHVRFRTNNAVARTGFRLTFQASVEVCGGDLTTDVGSFTSPNYPGLYAHSRVCTWLIRVQQGRRVTLTFDDFNIEEHINCNYDYVGVYNGILSDSPVIGRYCGTTTPAVVESRGNTMKVVFRTDGSVSNGGFRAHYTSQNEQTCGGMLTDRMGNITSPYYGNGNGTGNYTNNDQCIWILSNQNTTSSSIYVKFNQFMVETHGRCVYDFLEVREGNNENGALVGKYCGNTTLPPPVIAPTPYVWLRWKTDFSLVDLGFWLSYGFTDCGGILTEDNGVVTSPNFPFNYNHSDFCAWQIIGPEGYQVKIDFTDFNVEHHPSCRWDSVDILNGPLPTSPSVGPFCGETLPGTLNKTFISQSNAVRVLFKTDSSVHRNGFRFRYSFSSGGCSGIYHSNSGVIKTPNYDATPGDYPHNAECMWDINVEDGYHVVLTFKPPFDLEAHASCAFDYVEVSDALPNGTLVSLGRWCGLTTPPVLKSTGARMVAKFRSDATTRGHGFAANWTAGCGAIFTEDSGSFISPGYPNAYVDNLRCNYTIATDPQRFVVLEFDSLIFAIEGGANCPYDYVQAFPGNDSSGRSLGKFCGTTVPQPVSSLGSMFVQFVTDSSIQNKGFRALYSVSDCGGVFTDPDGIIKTPTHPVNYHHNANCTWNITVENNRVVDLKFLSFDLEAHSTCRYDYVEIFDGGSLTSPSMGKFCGQTLPPLLRTTGNTMLVNFVSDYNVAAKGFSAAYRTTFGVNQGCGGVLNSTSGTLKAVDIDNDGEYENALDCKWVIIVGDNQVVRFIVTGMDIEAHSRCMYDYLLIHDGMSEDDPIIGRYCGTQAPPAIQATSNTLYIRFFSDYTVTKAGFNATYTQEDALCGGAFTATTDPVVITSPSFPGSLSQSLKCRWTIDTPEENQQVRLFLTSINLINDNNCSQEYLEFRDSPLGWTGRSIHFCGSQVPSSSFDSAGRTVNINYVISANSGSQGFSLKYQIASCNKTYTGSSGRILSPGWPGNYQSNSNCEIAVSAPAGNYISLYFNSFYIEPHPNCRFDYLQIHNGSSADSPVITQLCGNTLPNPVFATGNTIWMNFMTDASVTHPGFDISWTATPQGIGCGGELTGINGSLTSPNYPGNYTERHSCRWIITVPRRRIVTLMFTDINLLGSADCERAYVEVFNGNIDSAPSFGRFCGNEIPARLQTSGNTALVKFISDGFHSAPGFRLKFTS